MEEPFLFVDFDRIWSFDDRGPLDALVDGEGPERQRAAGTERVNDRAGARGLAVDELERRWDGPFTEQAPTRAQHYREDPQPVFVDQTQIVQGAGEPPAAVD